jgi:H+-translocating diphosphatase
MVAAVADVVIPACAALGIGFALWQWFLVSKVKVSAYAASGNGHHNGGAVFRADDDFDEDVGMGDEEEEGNVVVAVARCAEVQSAISVGEYMLCRFKPCV